MDDQILSFIKDDIKEIKKDVKEVKNEVMTLKIKVALISAAIGASVGTLFKKLGL